MANILAVDDEQDILVLIQNILQRDGHKVDTIAQPDKVALNAFAGYDLILLDVMMPHLNGFDLCEKIRPIVDCPILFLTAKAEEAAVVEGFTSGGDDYISKPFSIRELSARVNAHLRRENRGKTPY